MTLDAHRTDILCRVYGALLYAYPKEFRERFGAEMRQVFRDRCRAASPGSPMRFFLAIGKDWVLSAGRERMTTMSATWNHRLLRAARGSAFALLSLLILVSASAPFLRAYVISSSSMQKSVEIGDHLLVQKLGPQSPIARDEIVTLRYPVDPKMTFVKRVIGIPGDRIRIVDKQVIRNGRRLVEPYAAHVSPEADAFRDNFPSTPNLLVPQPGLDMLTHHVSGGEVVVPEGSFFVLGDNRDDSLDSRYWGFVPRGNIVGRPLFVYWSWDKQARQTRWNRTMHILEPEHPQEVTP
jgi:signal peptidase I